MGGGGKTEPLTVPCFVHIHSVRRRAKTRRWKGKMSSFAMSYRDRPTWPLHPARSTEGCAQGEVQTRHPAEEESIQRPHVEVSGTGNDDIFVIKWV